MSAAILPAPTRAGVIEVGDLHDGDFHAGNAPEHRHRDLLRFITCGSVDDGKSTLIGRLLYDSKQLPEDQLSALERDSLRSGTAAGELDLALAVDGLAAEREQGITIDVAYRFFSTERRSFIVADTPGHEQYTRNMATGASTADAAVLLVDARKGLSRQTRRHSLIVATLGIRHIVVAVNKMDLVDWSHEVFAAIMAEYRAFARDLGFQDVTGIPLAAKGGDNVSRHSSDMPWYDGPDLLAKLEGLEVGSCERDGPFRLPVQWVNRPDADFRGFAGLVTGGAVRPGDRVVVLPSGEETRIARIVTQDGDLPVAVPGRSVTLTLADEVDVSRGSVVADVLQPPRVTGRLGTRLFWMSRAPLREGATYLVKLGAQTASATVERVKTRVDLESGRHGPADALDANDLGDVTLLFDRLVTVDDYAANRDMGSLILIDRDTFDTVGMGLVLPSDEEKREPVRPPDEPRAPSPNVRYWLPAPFAAPWRSALKTASWRVAGTLITVAAALWLTADLRTALLLGLFEIVVKFVLQFGHERLWTRIGLGLRTRPGPAPTRSTPT